MFCALWKENKEEITEQDGRYKLLFFSFLNIFSPKNTDFDNHPRVPLWKSKCPAEKFQHTEQKYPWLDTLKRVRGTVSLYHPPSPKVAQLSAKRPPWPAVSPMGEYKSVWMGAWFPQLGRILPEFHLLLAPSRVLRWAACLRCGKGQGE